MCMKPCYAFFRRMLAIAILLPFSLISLSSPYVLWNVHAEAKDETPPEPNVMQVALSNLGRKVISIDLSAQRAKAIEDGKVVAEYPISTGRWDTPTPKGRFQVYRKQELRVSNLEVPYRMPYYMAFTKSESHGLHALPYLGGNATSSHYWQEGLTHIGTPVSNGCVRFLPEDAAKLYEWAEVGTEGYIGYTEEHH